jgi:hypothetical protein
VTRADAPFPLGAPEDDWRLTRARKAADVNAKFRDAVDRTGYSLFKTGLSLSESPQPWNRSFGYSGKFATPLRRAQY